ncbi:nucleoside diphosphate-linked moiety X motif 17-like isoform X2 [Trematomus bernacchii]|uniref:nucleoside diphosphate-linked moiety X motif 17-like isoform X2 n=1 Tax=Trematomus bernacchii TaxID=40690 RepID=UPI00146F4B46|nr:nucleoside diphosphate-linked moiety X motif 17-like isoform X2 [Trematomus bernacchii]
MERVRRVLVHFCKDGAAQPAHFVQSITGHFSEGGEDEVEVGCSLERNRLILHRADAGRGVTLKRHAFCPIKHLSVTENAALPLDVQQRGVDVGVAIILQTANQKVLLTRRAKELRIFPNIWVPPGGHLELDETLLDAGLRELQEETGLKLEPEEGSPNILGLWERSSSETSHRGLPAAALAPLSPGAAGVSEPVSGGGQRLSVGRPPAGQRRGVRPGRRESRPAAQRQCVSGLCRWRSERLLAASGGL